MTLDMANGKSPSIYGDIDHGGCLCQNPSDGAYGMLNLETADDSIGLSNDGFQRRGVVKMRAV